MRLHEYLLKERKVKFKSVEEFISKTKVNVTATKYYYYERGQVVPPSEELEKIIKALELHPKFVITLWLYEHIKDDTLKAYFPLPVLKDNEQVDHVEIPHANSTTTTISKGHIQFFIKNRLAFSLLEYIYINANDKLTIDELYFEFSKHSKSDLKKYLSVLVEYGYIGYDKNKKYHAYNTDLIVPSSPEFEELRQKQIADSLDYGYFCKPVKTKYGEYPPGISIIFKRTLDKEQYSYITSIVRNLYNEYRKMPSKPGQEFSLSLLLGPFLEREIANEGKAYNESV